MRIGNRTQPFDGNHSLNGSSVLTATFNSYGDRQISTPYKINTPEPIDKKIGTVDYVREGTLYQIWYKSAHWGLLGKWVKYNKNYFFIYTFLFSGTRTGQTRGWIFTRDSSKDVKSRKDVPFGGLILNDVSSVYTGSLPQMIDDPSTCPLPYHNQATHYLIAARSYIPA